VPSPRHSRSIAAAGSRVAGRRVAVILLADYRACGRMFLLY
jgi:hypothetical protein